MIEDGFFDGGLGRLHYRRAGRGVPLLLMHSNGRSAHEFDALAERLADRFDVVAWDMPGQGDSDPPPRHLSIADYGRAARELARAVFAAPAVFGGSSIGAAIALNLAAEASDDVAGALVIELPVTRDGAWWRANWAMVETLFTALEEPADTLRPKFRDLSPALEARLRIDRCKAGPKAMMSVMWAGRDAADEMGLQIARLATPALFINGDRGVAPDFQAVVGALNPRVRLVMIANAGHYPQTDAPDETAAAIAAQFALAPRP